MGVIQRGKKMTKKSQKKTSKPVRKTRPRKMKVNKVKVRRRTMKAVEIPPSDVLNYPSGNLREAQWAGDVLEQRISEDLPVYISYYDDPENTHAVKTWRDRNLSIHRTPGPAYVEYYPNGQLKKEEWYLHGSLGREGDGPIVVEYRDDGSLWHEMWVNEDENLFRENGPALIEYYPDGTTKKSEKWYTTEDPYDMFIEEFEDIPPHNDLGPAVKEYYEDGALKREQWRYEDLQTPLQDPTVIEYYPDGTTKMRKGWYIDGELGRDDDKPAVEEYYEDGRVKTTSWYNAGQLDRDGDAPAVIEFFPSGVVKTQTWYRNGIPFRANNNPAVEKYNEAGEVIEQMWIEGGRYIGNTIEYYSDDTTKMREEWYIDEELGRDDDKPAVEEYYEDGRVKTTSWYNAGQLDRDGDAPAVIEFFPSGVVKTQTWYRNGRPFRANNNPMIEKYNEAGKVIEQIWFEGDISKFIEYYPDDTTKMTEEWYIDGELGRDDDKPAVIEFFPSGVVKTKSWYRTGIPFRANNNPAVEKYNEAGEVIEQMWFERGRYIGNTPPAIAAEPASDVEKNVSLFYETCQMNFEADSGRADVDDETKEKIIKYSLDPIIYLGRRAIRSVLAFYDGVPQTVHDKNSTFRELVFNERHTRFLTSEDSLRQSMLDARLVVTQWVSWYYQHTRIDARDLISKLRDNVSKIREYLPNIYKPEMYADLFEAFFFGNATINDFSSPSDSNKYKELNFYLHAGDESGFADRIIDKMMTGLRNYNYLHEWVDAKLEENDTSSLEKAKELCKIGKAGKGWLCGDGLFDTIPQLLSEAEGDVEWKQLDPDQDKNSILNLWMIGQALMKKSGKTKAEYTGYDTQEFKSDLKDILWANKTFRTKWGYNQFDYLEMALEPNGAVERISDVLGMSILESIYDSLPE